MRNLYFQRSEWEHYSFSDKVYVVDILLIRNNVEFLESIKGCLKGVFQRKTWIKLLEH